MPTTAQSSGPQVVGVRHGEVDNPRNVIYSGLAGYRLSQTGREQAQAVADALRDAPVTAIYASPLERAQETAAFISEATGVGVTTDERLVEWKHWEQWAGLTWDELRTDHADSFDRYVNDPGSVTSGESLDELADRMEAWLGDVAEAHTGGLVVAVTHLEPLRAILLRKLGRPATDLFQVNISQCEVVRLAPEPAAEPVSPGALASQL